MGCDCDDAAGADLAALSTPVPVIEPLWGPDVAASWRVLEEPARALVIGPGSEVDAVRVMLKGIGEVVCSVERPLLDIALPKGTIIKPFATKGRAVVDFTALVTSPNSRSQPMYARLELFAFDRKLDHPPPLARSPRQYARATYATTTVDRLVEGWHTRGARAFKLFLDNRHATDAAQWRVVAHRYGDDGATPAKDDAPLSPTGYPVTTPTYNTLAAVSNQQYNLELAAADEVDMVFLYAKNTAGAAVLGYEATVRG